MPSTILSDNGVSSGSAGLKTTAASDGVLILQTTTSGGTATNAIYVDTTQQVGMGTSSPATRLHIYGAFNEMLRLESSSTSFDAALRIFQNGTQITNLQGGVGVTGGGTFLTTVSSAPLVFGTANTERMRVNAGAPILCLSGGNTSATGTGIAFPATQSASSDANTLDDYEEGTWTPTLVSTGASFTYPRGQYGSYCKIGSLVYAQFYIGADASGTTSNGCTLSNLPFQSANLNALAQSSGAAWISATQMLGFTVGNNSTDVTLWRQNSGISVATAAQVAGGYLVGMVVYRAA